MSSSQPRIKIRCPNCQNDGSARADLLNRRVACKHCSHVFRVIPIEGEISTHPAGMSVSSASAIIPGSPALDRLRADLAQALEAAQKAQAAEALLRREVDQLHNQLDQTIESPGDGDDEAKNRLRDEELRFLRDQLDRARAEVEVEARKRREAVASLSARTTEHAEALRTLEQQLQAIQLDHQNKLEAEARTTAEVDQLRSELAEANAAIKAIESLRDRTSAEQSQAAEASRTRIAQLEARLVEAEATRTHRDQLGRELEHLQKRFTETERLAREHKDSLESLRIDQAQTEADRLAELGGLRDQLAQALAVAADAAILRQELDEAKADRDRLHGELENLHGRIAETERSQASSEYLSTEIDLPCLVAPLEPGTTDPAGDETTVFDGGQAAPEAEPERLRAEASALRAEVAELTADLADKQAEMGELAQRSSAETKELRRALYEARLASETSSKAYLELLDRVRELEADASPMFDEPVPSLDEHELLEAERQEAAAILEAEREEAAAILEAERKQAAAALEAERSHAAAALEAERTRAVDEAIKGAWADFERRLAETQAKLQAANARADLMETEAREAREQISARERTLDLVGDSSSFGGEGSSLTSVRILDARGTARLTIADAEARLGLARQLAVERKDKALIDRITKMADKVKADLESRNHTLAETLVRGAEIETGLDPGGFSINGLRIFRASPTIVGSLNALAPSFDRVMRDGDLDAIRTTIGEMRRILGDQAGLPEIRRPGRMPSTKLPMTRPEAFRLFIDALVGEHWLVRPVVQKKPLPDTALGTYAGLVEAACVARKVAEAIDPEQIAFLDEIIQAACLMLTRRQQPDGHFPFLDPRGRPSRAATVVEGMIAQRSDAVKDGWVVHVDPIGMAQTETGPCGIALARAAALLNRDAWFVAAAKAAEWAVGQPCLPSFVATAASAGLVARSYLDAGEDPDLVGLIRKLTLGLLPGQVENGRWVDPQSATTSNHLLILRALENAWEAIPANRDEIREELKRSIDLAMASFLEECKILGVPAQGGALRDLIRHRELFPNDRDPRLEPAILDSATVVQELCHDGAKRKLGVAADQLAALMQI